LALIPVFLFLAVWVPCCTSDIVFPMLLTQDSGQLITNLVSHPARGESLRTDTNRQGL
jgi:hypothetical protein